MFRPASEFNKFFWNVSSVTESSFNTNIPSRDVYRVTDIYHMFEGASEFNSDIVSWDVSNVASIDYMFGYTPSFNNTISSSWDVSNGTSIRYMFYYISEFINKISSWDVSSVPDMYAIFYEAS